jgi:hypothetical protein
MSQVSIQWLKFPFSKSANFYTQGHETSTAGELKYLDNIEIIWAFVCFLLII